MQGKQENLRSYFRCNQRAHKVEAIGECLQMGARVLWAPQKRDVFFGFNLAKQVKVSRGEILRKIFWLDLELLLFVVVVLEEERVMLERYSTTKR